MNEQEIKRADYNFNNTILLNVGFPISVTDHGEGFKDERFSAQITTPKGLVAFGETREQAVLELHRSLMVKFHHDYGLNDQLFETVVGPTPSADEMMHMIESMLFDGYYVKGVMPSTQEKARQLILRMGGPKHWDPTLLGFKGEKEDNEE